MKLKLKKPEIDKKRVKRVGVDILFLVVGCCISGVSTIGILIPNGLTSGGITGMVRIIQGLVRVDFSILFYAFAFTIFIICCILLGWKEARKIIVMTILYPSILFIFEHFDFSLVEDKDLFLAAIFCGVLGGICSGLVFYRGYSFGGTDTIAKLIQRKLMPHVGLSQILLVIDACVIIGSGFLYGRNIALYALVTQVIFSKTVDYVMYGFETRAVQVEIITSKHDVIANYIMNEISRGVSNVTVTGEYTKTVRQKIITICSPRESMLIKKYVAKTDRDAFVTIILVDTVWGNGEGFGDISKE
ncbi:MAG TPA: YitT family protein [Anaerovoracaceae bacterium]|nr:YitT family protein [Anaerovoracaceae bacterium]